MLEFTSNNITSLIVGNNSVEIETFNFGGNMLTSVVFGNIPKINRLDIAGNFIETINLSTIGELNIYRSFANSFLQQNFCVVDSFSEGAMLNVGGQNVNEGSYIYPPDAGITIVGEDGPNYVNMSPFDCDGNSLGINEQAIATLSLYPNPTNDIVNIKTDMPIDSYEVYNLVGQKVLNGNQNTVDLTSLKAGVYMVKILIGEATTVKRIIKN
ncbi:T9SS C-terminal target domain-containing protein [Dokdonia sinensis]|uniref:T9SS C-terminal target domain-containing protein n=1 Tax=Dokdonia sinensis TaxID=2479847 RepID=A0A3M0GEG4_9FLAO|nr:T9SS type A sorting domain-containing protein [Dokdonia sinensis]RMB63295.1 T9SS C-terminal target domain-containing protein [Dokdonia sinensis]